MFTLIMEELLAGNSSGMMDCPVHVDSITAAEVTLLE